MKFSRTSFRFTTLVQLMEWEKAVLLQPLAKDEANHLFSRHLQFVAGASDRRLNVVVKGHHSTTLSTVTVFPLVRATIKPRIKPPISHKPRRKLAPMPVAMTVTAGSTVSVGEDAPVL